MREAARQSLFNVALFAAAVYCEVMRIEAGDRAKSENSAR